MVEIKNSVRMIILPRERNNSLILTICNVHTLLISSFYEHVICVGYCSYLRGQLNLSFSNTMLIS